MRTFISLLSLFLAASGSSLAQVANSAWVYPSATGNLLYQLDERGQRINDFSNCGYRSGNEPLPNVTAVIPQARWVYLSPGAGDDTALIQAAIDSVAAFTPDANGWRGVVFLNAGEYQLATTLNITASGVVLKGAGDDPLTGTRLRATDARQYTLISVTGSGSRSTVAGTTRNFTQKLVPAGSRTFEVDSTSGLAVGHTAIVSWPMTANFIAEIDMDLLGAASGDPASFPWAANSSYLKFDRTITRIDGNWITVDMPLPQTFEQQYGGGQIWRYAWTGRIEQVGIEDIYGFSDYASSTDENHAWVFIGITNTQHGWVKNITGQYFGGSAVLMNNGVKWFTVADSQCLDPISIITGGRRYSFNNDGAEATLIVNCYAREGRHDFAFGSGVAGPNAIVQCSTDTSYADTGPHHRWSVGGLFDLVTVNGASINAENRGNLGTGQGWAGAYMAVWNSKTNEFSVRNPPTARNWLIGSIGTITSKSNYPIGADPAGTYESSGPSGTGKNVYPRSLYHGQLQQRMKWKDSEFSEWWLGDVDQHSSIGGTGEAMNCDATWLSQVEALDAQPAVAKFDELAGSRHVAFTLDVPNTPGDTIVAASLTVSLRAIGSATADNIWLDSTASPQTFASLGWNPISTTAPTVRTLEVSPTLLLDGRLNVAIGTNCAVDYAVLHVQVQKLQPSVSSITLTAVADAHVRGGANAGINFGTATSLDTKQDSSADNTREAFVRWDLSGITGKIVHAKVRLMPTSTGQAGNENAVSFVSDDTWSETTVTFATKPAAQPLFAQWIPVANQAVEFSVTPQVLDAQFGDGTLSLRIASTDNHGSAGNVSYASRENATTANRPQLILTIENPPTAAVKASTDNILSTDAAWTNGFVPVNPDTATWNSTSLAGTMTFDTDLNWAGLIVTNPAGPLTFNSSQFLLLGSGGIDLSASTVDLTLNHPVHFSADQTWNIGIGRSLAVNGPISGALTLEKSGTGNLVFSANNTYTGTLAVRQGTLQVDASGSLGANTASLSLGTGSAGVLGTVGNLTLNTSATLGSLAIKSNTTTASCLLSIASGSTLTVSGFQSGVIGTEAARAITNLSTGAAGTGGSLVVNGDFQMSEQHSNSVVNLSGLADFRVQSPNGSFSLGMNNRSVGTLTLANSTNIINVGTLSVGFTATGNSGGLSTLTLGPGTNAIQAPVIDIGGVKTPGQILFPGSGGSLVITGADGSGSSLITIGHSSAGTYSGNNNLLLAGRNVTVNASTVTIGQKSGAGDGTVGATVTFDTGTFTANTIQMGVADGTSSGTINSGFTVGGATANSAATGVVNISDNLLLAAATAGTATPATTLVINGGTVNVNTAASAANGIYDTSEGAGTSTTSLTLAGGTLNLNGGSIGGTTGTGKKNIGTLDFRTGTLSNVAQINGGAGLTKTATGTLTLSGTNTYTGPTIISAGTLALGTGNALPNTSPLSIGAATLHATTPATEVAGTLTVSGAATIQLAPGARVEFLASNALTWPGSLNITGSFVSGVSLRFGNNASGLTTAQLAKISAPGYTGFVLNSNGYLTDSAAVPSNTAPVADEQSLTTAEDFALQITLGATDPEGDPLTYSIVTPPASGTLSGTAPNLTFTPAANFNGSASFTFRANDGALDSTPATVSITITPVNDTPVATAQSVTTAEDTALPITLSGADLDGNPLTYSIVTAPASGTLSGTAPNLTYTPAANFNGSASFTFRANDGALDSAPATVTITITPVNDAPVATAQTVTTSQNIALPITLSGTDVEGSTLTYTIVSPPASGTLSGTEPNLIYTPAANYTGAASFTFRVNDGTLDSAPATVSITIGGENTWIYNGTAATSNTWSTAGSWSGGIIANGANSTANFILDITAARTITLGGNRTIGNIVFTDTVSSHDLTISGNTLTLDVTSGAPVIDVTQSGRTLAVSSVIAGNDGLTKNGFGTLLLSAANTYSGGTSINAGTVRIGHAAALGASSSAVSVASGAALNLSGINMGTNTNALALNGSGIGGTGALLSSTGTGQYAGAISLAGNTTIGNSGTVNLTFTSATKLNTNGHTLTFKGNTAGQILFKPAGSGITGSGAVVVDGAYLRLVDSGGNISSSNYTGTTTVINGGAILYFNNNIGTGNINLNGGTLSGYAGAGFTRPLGTGSGQIQISGGESGFGMNGPGTINFSNVTEVQWGSASFNPSKFIVGGGSVTFGGTATFAEGIDLNGANRTILTTETAVLSGVIRSTTGMAGLIKEGGGTLSLSAANTYTGSTTVTAGTLKLGANNVIPNASNVIIGAATLDANTRTDTAGTLDVTGNATITLGSGAALAFADSKAVDWTGGTLNITGTLGATSLRFGASAAALTSGPGGQLSRISVNGSGLGTFVLNANGYLVLGSGGSGPVASFEISQITSPHTLGTPILGITLIAKDASDATATDFTGTVTFGGTAGITGTSANFVAGELTGVSVTPSVAGSNLTFTVDDGSGHTGSVTIATIQTPYEAWAAGGVAFNHDTNGDGVDNGMAWVLGAADPNENALNKLPVATLVPEGLRFTFLRSDVSESATTLSVQYSTELLAVNPWTDFQISTVSAGPDANGVTCTVEENDADADLVTVILPHLNDSTRMFARLRAINHPTTSNQAE